MSNVLLVCCEKLSQRGKLCLKKNMCMHMRGIVTYFIYIVVLESTLRWKARSFYIYHVPSERVMPAQLSLNKGQGCTVSVRKHGGLDKAWLLAKQVANWVKS